MNSQLSPAGSEGQEPKGAAATEALRRLPFTIPSVFWRLGEILDCHSFLEYNNAGTVHYQSTYLYLALPPRLNPENSPGVIWTCQILDCVICIVYVNARISIHSTSCLNSLRSPSWLTPPSILSPASLMHTVWFSARLFSSKCPGILTPWSSVCSKNSTTSRFHKKYLQMLYVSIY